MAKTCARRGCQTELSRARLQHGLRTCAAHGTPLRRGNPLLRRLQPKRLCQAPGCRARLGQQRIRCGARKCKEHGGPLPNGTCSGLHTRVRASGKNELELSQTALPAAFSCKFYGRFRVIPVPQL